MKASTEAIIVSGIKTNLAIQQDNVAMLEASMKLSEKARELEIFSNIKAIAQKEDFDTITFNALNTINDFCNKVKLNQKACMAMSIEDRRAKIVNAIDTYIENNTKKIHSELVNMLDASVIDIDTIDKFNSIESLAITPAPIYNKIAVENICSNFRTIIQEISFLANSETKDTYLSLRKRVVNTLGDKLAMVHTAITHEGYVTIDLPQPEVQTSKAAGITSAESLTYMGKLMNAIVYKELNQRLGKFKLNLDKQLQDTAHLEDTVHKTHLIAQLIMATKGAIKLMKQYHTATINELGC